MVKDPSEGGAYAGEPGSESTVPGFFIFWVLATGLILGIGQISSAVFVTLVISGDSFLRNMVRIMVGTLVEIAWGQKPQGTVAKALGSGQRSHTGQTAPAHGLWLEKVFYDPDPFVTRGLKNGQGDWGQTDPALVSKSFFV